jgi:uncharacterized membrane protein YhaH (DUF805 family)
MDFASAVSSALSQYAVRQGRASRSEFWWFQLFLVLCYAVGVALTVALRFPVVLFVWLGFVVPTVCACVRRLHDTGRSGAWWFIAFVPYGGIVLIVFCCLRGEAGENAYGPPPGWYGRG